MKEERYKLVEKWVQEAQEGKRPRRCCCFPLSP